MILLLNDIIKFCWNVYRVSANQQSPRLFVAVAFLKYLRFIFPSLFISDGFWWLETMKTGLFNQIE